MLISQDAVRSVLLYVKAGQAPIGSELLFQLAVYGKEHCEVVILEGILNSKWYEPLFKKLLKEFNKDIYAFYFDIPFDETLRRHKTKPNANEFG